MQLCHIDRSKLLISALNMRAGKKQPDIADILPTVRARGILVPLIVRPADEGRFEIVAGRRRFFAAAAVAAESGLDEPLPCALIEAGDDAAALEASLIENVARREAHEVQQWETFTRLVRAGRSPADLAATFGVSDRQVRQVLALGNLLPRIRALYLKEEIDAGSVRLLTMATKAQQQDWLAIHADPERFTPTGHNLKSWLFGGAPIATKVALFDLADYDGAIVADLFGEGGYFADADAFWTAQNAAIEARRAAYLEAGWREVVTLPPQEHFHAWVYERRPRSKGGKVIIDVSPRGEVTFHEGLLSRKDARRLPQAANDGDNASARPARPEVTAAMQTYIDLHRHAAVRARLVDHGAVALRLMAAHAIAGSHLYRVEPEPRRAANEAIAESVETALSETAFDGARRAALAVLGFDAEAPTVIGGAPDSKQDATAAVFTRLLTLDDGTVLSVVAVVMGEALPAGSAVVALLGQYLGVDMAEVWAPDDAFFGLIRDKEVLTGMIGEVAGETVAAANKGEKADAQKALIRDCLAGANGRAKVEGWVPRWLRFPANGYTPRGCAASVTSSAAVAALIAPAPDGEGEAPAAPPLAEAA